MSSFKPILAAREVDFNTLDYSNLGISAKLDGIRAIVRNGVVVSRKLLPIPNKHVQSLFGHLEHYDGELIVGPPGADDVYRQTSSGVMSREGTPDVKFYAFDHVENPNYEFYRRCEKLSFDHSLVRTITQLSTPYYEALLSLETTILQCGFEGLMGRKMSGPDSLYKFGRATPKSGTLWKLKRTISFEAKIIGLEEEMSNENEATEDELGNTKRSSHKENKIGKGTLGAMICLLPTGIRFNCGIFKGFDANWKQQVWHNPEIVVGKIGKFEKFGIGEYEKPRHPRFTGLRDPIDM